MEESNKIGSDLFEIILSVQKVGEFEKWIYCQASTVLENLIGEENYLELISADYKGISISQLKQFVKSNLPERLIHEFEQELIMRNSKVIKGKCIKEEALDHHGNLTRRWGVVVGEMYEFLIFNFGNPEKKGRAFVNFVDRENDFYPSGFVPMELFEIDLESVPELYIQKLNTNREMNIEIAAFSRGNFRPNHYSFWEDFYDDDVKAVETYFELLRQMGIVYLWE